jgi:nucleoid-associated protein YgaU
MNRVNRITLGVVLAFLSFSAACTSTQDPDDAEDMALNSSEYQGAEGSAEEKLTAENNAAEQDYSGQAAPAESASSEIPPPPVPEDAVVTAEAAPESVPDSANVSPTESAAQPSEETAAEPAAITEFPAAVTDEAATPQSEDQVTSQADAPVTPEEVAAAEATEQIATEAPPEPAVIEAGPELSEPAVAAGTIVEDASSYEAPAVLAEESVQAIPPTPSPIDSEGSVASNDTVNTGEATSVSKKSRAEAQTSEPTTSRRAQADSGSSGEIDYLVAPGDSVIEIATRIYGSSREWQTIARANGLQAPYVIYPGDVLNIKVLGTASAFAQAYKSAPETQITVQKGDTLSSISQRLLGTATAWKYIWKINESELPNPNQLRPGQVIRFRDYRGIQANL